MRWNHIVEEFPRRQSSEICYIISHFIIEHLGGAKSIRWRKKFLCWIISRNYWNCFVLSSGKTWWRFVVFPQIPFVRRNWIRKLDRKNNSSSKINVDIVIMAGKIRWKFDCSAFDEQDFIFDRLLLWYHHRNNEKRKNCQWLGELRLFRFDYSRSFSVVH